MNKKLKKSIPFLGLMVLVLALGLVSAGDFKIQNSTGSDLFTVDTSGNVNAAGTLKESGNLLSSIYLALSGGALTGNLSSNNNISTTDTIIAGYFVGDGSSLTSVPTYNSTYAGYTTDGVTIKYQNISNLPTCGAGEHLTFNSSGDENLNCTADAFDNTNLAYYNNSVTWADTQQFNKNINLTQNITGAHYITADYFVGAGSKLTSLPTDMATIKYQNISNLPTCGSGEHLDYDGSALTCTADSGGSYASLDALHVAFTNRTNTFTGQQVFNEDLNLSTADLVFKDNTSSITRAGKETTNITIDSLGNIIIRLG